MNFNKILRILVCLVLVCTLLIGVSPVRSNAYLLPGFSDDVVCTVLIIIFLAANGFVISPANLDFNLQFCEEVSDSFDYFLEEQLDYGGFIDTDGDGDPDDDDERDPTDDEILDAVNKLKSDKTKYQELLNQVGAPPRWTDLDYTIAQWGSGLFNAYTEFIRFCAERGYFGLSQDVTAPSGKMYYNDVLLPAMSDEYLESYNWVILTYYPFRAVRVSSDNCFVLSTSDSKLYARSNYSSTRDLSYDHSPLSLNNAFPTTGYGSNTIGLSFDSLVWSDHDIYNDQGELVFAGSDPTSTLIEVQQIEPLAIVPDSVASGIVAGGVASTDIFLPDGVDLTSIFEGVSAGDYAALQSNLVASAEGLANGSVTINNYQQSITYNYPSDSEDPEEPDDSIDPTQDTGSGGNDNTGSDSSDSDNEGSDIGDSEQQPAEGTFAGYPVLRFLAQIGELLQNIFDGNLLEVRNFFEPFLAGIREDLFGIDSSIQEGFDDVVESNQDINDSVKDIFDQNQEIKDSVKDEFQNQNEILAQESQTLSDRLLNGVQSLFIPSDGFVDEKVEDLRKNYAFADSIALTAKDLETFLTSLGSVPPVIRINLGAATTPYNLGGDMVFIDFSFYEPYKASMDAVLSAFLWLWFCWRVVLTLPGIIGGVSGLTGAFTDSRHVGSDPVPASSWQVPFGSSHGVVSMGSRASPQFQQGGNHHYTEWVRSRNDFNYKAFHRK